MSMMDKPAEIRLHGTETQLMQLLDWLKSEMGSRILEVSPKYRDRKPNGSSEPDTYRIYIKLRY